MDRKTTRRQGLWDILFIFMNSDTSPHIQESALEHAAVPSETGVHSFLRKTLLVVVVLFFILVIVFLVYQNGKSIYDNGL